MGFELMIGLSQNTGNICQSFIRSYDKTDQSFD